MEPVVEEEFFSCSDVSLCKNADAVVAVDHHHLGTTVGIDGMVCESNLVAFASRVHHILFKNN